MPMKAQCHITRWDKSCACEPAITWICGALTVLILNSRLQLEISALHFSDKKISSEAGDGPYRRLWYASNLHFHWKGHGVKRCTNFRLCHLCGCAYLISQIKVLLLLFYPLEPALSPLRLQYSQIYKSLG